MAELRIDGVGKSYGQQSVLADVGLSVESGTLVALLGASGSGKTTLLRLICGFERLDAGRIHLDGRLIAGQGTHLAPERRRIGYVAQEGALFPHLSVADNIGFGLDRAARRGGAAISRLLATGGLPASFAGRHPHELSGGEQQRVAMARALAPRPRIVLLDEPFSSLDAALRNETRAAVADALADAGATALLVTHDQAEALSMGRKVAVLRDGRLAQVAEPELLYRRPIDAALARFLGEANLLPGTAHGDAVACALGRLPLAAGMPSGPVEVMVRPEQIRLVASGSEPGSDLASASVTAVRFSGPDAAVALRLAGPAGAVITARVCGHRKPRVGTDVRLAVDGEVVAFARGATPAAEPAGSGDRRSELGGEASGTRGKQVATF